MLDGIVENYTAAVLDPYFDHDGAPTDNRGMDFIDPELLMQAVPRLDALGFQAHFHALGDRAVRLGLDAVEAARRQNGWSDTRPHLAHLQLVHPDDIPRFRRLGAVANVQALWAVHEGQMDKLTLPFLGPVAGARQYPLRSFRRHGVTIAMGSDWSVSTADPFAQMDIAVNRVIADTFEAPGVERTRTPFMPEESIELTEALTAFTAGSAYASHLDEAGTIAVGRLADFAVLDRDLFDRGAGRDRRHARGRDVRRRRRRARDARARGLSRRRSRMVPRPRLRRSDDVVEFEVPRSIGRGVRPRDSPLSGRHHQPQRTTEAAGKEVIEMMHPLAIYAVQDHLADLMAEAEANRKAKLGRQPRTAGLVASLVAFARNLFGSNDAHSAASPA